MWDTLIPWIIALVVIGLVIVLISVLSGKGQGALEFFKKLWRFR